MTARDAGTAPATLYVALPDAAARVSLCARTIRRAIDAGELTSYKFGKAVRVRLDELDDWAQSKAQPNPRNLKPVRARVTGGRSHG